MTPDRRLSLAESVQQVAAVLGDRTGTCPKCRRPVRLTSGGLVPYHHRMGLVGICPGGEQPPATDGGGGEPLTLCDPAAGTSHFLIRAVDYLWQWYTTGELSQRQMHGEGVTGGLPLEPAEALRRIAAGVDGVELDPLTAAVARLRMTIYLGHLAHRAGMIAGPLRLDRIPAGLVPRVAVGDSLLIGKVTRAAYNRLHPQLADLPGAAFPLSDFGWREESRPESAQAYKQPALFEAVGRG